MQTTRVHEARGQNRQLPSGSESARQFDDVLSCYLPRFRRIAFRKLRNPADAEDAVQDALLSAYKHLDQFEGHAHLSTWLTAIVMNCSRMHLRRRLRHIHISLDERVGEEEDHSLSEEIMERSPDPERECRDAELYQRAMRAMEGLSPQSRTVLQLRYLQGCSTREAALILGVPKGTIKARLFRARTQLRERMNLNGRLHAGRGHDAAIPVSTPSRLPAHPSINEPIHLQFACSR